MKTSELQQAITELLHGSGYEPATCAQIARMLELRGKGSSRVERVLKRMVASGEAVRAGKRYSASSGQDTITGTISIARSGDGFVAAGEDEDDVRIPEDNLGTALPGDTVDVRMVAARRGGGGRAGARTEPRVVRVSERAKHKIVGTLKTTGKFFYVVPLNPSYRRQFRLPDAGGGKLEDRVVAEFRKWDDPNSNPEAEIVEVIGSVKDASLDTLAITREYDYPDEFPPAVERDAKDVAQLMSETDGREDLRDAFIFTIDPGSARDFDDALSLEKDDKGRHVLGIHIADVSHFVRPGSELDREALLRGNSVYFVDKVIPMLPETLSNGVCSLVPNEDRLAFSVFITLDDRYRPVSTRASRTIIRSKLRLTYEQAMTILDLPGDQKCDEVGADKSAVGVIRHIGSIAQAFRKRRFAQYALELDIPEYEVVVKGDGTVADVRVVEYDESHQLVEECMVAANEAVDRELSGHELALIHRIHEPPAVEKIEDLTAALIEMGLEPGNLSTQKALASFLEGVKDHPLVYDIRMSVLKSMSKAVYSSEAKGHYGLAKEFYAHFTSPIRRYPDLVVHRILAAMLTGAKTSYGTAKLSSISDECSMTEQKAEAAERALLEIKKYRLLEQELKEGCPEARKAVVASAMRYGLFVELVELGVQGLVHVSVLGDGNARYDSNRRVLSTGKLSFKAGDTLEVIVSRVDFEDRKIDFVPADRDTTSPSPPSPRRRKKRSRRG